MKNSRYSWLVVAMLWFVFLLNYLDRQVIFALFPLLRSGLHLMDYQLGLIPVAFLWVYAACSPLGGFLGDRLGRKRVIFFSLVIWSVISAVIGLTRSFPQILIAVGLMGVSEACYLPSGLAMVAEYHGERTRSLATGLHQTGSYFGMVIGGLGGGWISEHYGWRPVFLLLGTVGVIHGVVVLVGLRDKTEPQPGRPAGDNPSFIGAIGELLPLPGFLTLTLVFSAMSMGNWVLYTWMPLYLYERFHMSLSRAGFSATFFLQAGSAMGIVQGGWLADHFSSRTSRSRVLTQAWGLMAAAPFLLFVGITSSSALLLLALVVFGLGRGAYDANCMPVLCQIAPDRLRSTGYGLFNCAGCIAGGIVAAAAGALKATLGLGVTIQATGLLLFGSALLLFRLRLAPKVEALSPQVPAAV